MYEDQTYDIILERMMNRVSDKIDKRPSSPVYDLHSSTAIEFQILYIELEYLIKNSYGDTAAREFLILLAKDRGLSPEPATKAILQGEFTPTNIDVTGKRFNIGEINYVVTEQITPGTYKVQCETEGVVGNQYLGDMIPMEYIDGLQTASLTSVLIPGEDEEDTEVFRQRYFDSFNEQSFGGNHADYMAKVKSIEGVGSCKVKRVWNGDIRPADMIVSTVVKNWYESIISTVPAAVKPWLDAVYNAAKGKKLTVGGTVHVVITDSDDYGEASSTLVQYVQQTLDPEETAGEGYGLAPIGHVVSVASASPVSIEVKTTVTLVSKVTRTNEVAIKIDAAYSNVDLKEGYYMRTLGLYAVDPDKGEILYAVCIEKSNNCYMPPYNGVTVSAAYLQLYTTVGNADSVSLAVSPGAYATVGDIQALEKEIADLKAYVGYSDGDIYGVEVDFENKKFTRLAGAVNRSAGSGFDGINAFGGRKRCNLTNDGRVAAYYGEAGFSTTGKLTQAVDRNPVGTESPDENLKFSAGTIVQVMVEQPKFYYKVVPLKTEKRTKGAITRKIRYYVSDTPKAGFKLHPAFIVNGQENDVAYLAAFEGSLWDASASAYILDDSQVADFAADMLCSIANAKPLSGLTQNATRANIRKLAEKRGTGWEQGVVQTASASQMLMLIEYATFNMQSVIGNGAVSKTDDGKTSMTENTGATITLGNASGSVVNANGIQIVSYRGEENFWGNIWWWIDGINHYANATTGECETYVADHGFADDIKAAPYEDTGMTAKYGNGYISAFCYSEDFDWLFLPGEFNGNTALPVGDHCWNQNGTGWRVAVLGAVWSSGLSAGAFYWYLNCASSYRNRIIGGRLVYRKKVAA